MVIPAESAGVIVPALSEATFFTKNYPNNFYSPDTTDRNFNFTFEPENKFEQPGEALTVIQNSRDESEKKYLSEWSKNQDLRKKISELEEKLAKFKNVIEE
jgi:hypothetical protein